MHASKQISDRRLTRWLLLAMTASALMLLSACASPNAAPPPPVKVCHVLLPEAVLMSSRPNGALTIGLQRLEAALDDAIDAQTISIAQLDDARIAAARHLAALGDQSNATLIALQRWAQEAAARCAPD